MNRFFVLLFLFLGACAEKENVVRMAYEQRSFEDRVCNENECANVILNYPFFTDENLTASTLNEYIEQQMVMMFSFEGAGTGQSIQSTVQEFLDAFKDYAQEEGFIQSWEVDINAIVTFQNSKLLSVSFDAYSNTGGAHPNSFRQYVNFFKSEASLIRNDQLIIDKDGLLKMAEKAFREYHEVQEDVSLEEDGRFFLKDDTEFFLPVAVGLEKDELVLYYNSYEIAPYAGGPTMLRFSKREVKNLINKIAYD